MTPLLSLLAFVTLSIGILGYLDLGPWCTVGSCGYGGFLPLPRAAPRFVNGKDYP
jgi:hypothetical protein